MLVHRGATGDTSDHHHQGTFRANLLEYGIVLSLVWIAVRLVEQVIIAPGHRSAVLIGQQQRGSLESSLHPTVETQLAAVQQAPVVVVGQGAVPLVQVAAGDCRVGCVRAADATPARVARRDAVVRAPTEFARPRTGGHEQELRGVLRLLLPGELGVGAHSVVERALVVGYVVAEALATVLVAQRAALAGGARVPQRPGRQLGRRVQGTVIIGDIHTSLAMQDDGGQYQRQSQCRHNRLPLLAWKVTCWVSFQAKVIMMLNYNPILKL